MAEKKSSKLKSRIRKGIPEDFRGIAWPIIARIEKFKSQFEITYKDVVNAKDPECME